jgi:hypothetical protein
MIEKLKGKKELLHAPARIWEGETDEERAVRRAGLTDLQVDQEDALMAEAENAEEGMGSTTNAKELGQKQRDEAQKSKRKSDTEPSEIQEPREQEKVYRPITVTRESDRPGDIKTTEQRKKTVGSGGGSGGSSTGQRQSQQR